MAPHQRLIPLENRLEWQMALTGLPHAFGHTWESCHAMHLTTGFKTYLYCFESDNVRIVCPLSERTFDSYVDIVTPYGFSGFVGNGVRPDFPRYWKEFTKARGYVCGYIALNPIFENSTFFDSVNAYQSNSLYYLDLTLNTGELLANLDRNRKRQLKDWERIREGLILDKVALKEFFITNYEDFITKINASPANRFSNETLSFLCDLENVIMVGAGRLKSIEAVYVFGYTQYLGDCLFNVPLPEGRHHATTLLWYGVNHLKSLHIPILNLGGGVCEDDAVAGSKQRFGSRRVSFKCLKEVYEPATYDKLCRRVGTNPEDMNGYFPPYRRPEYDRRVHKVG